MLILTGFSCQQNTEEMTYPVTQKIPVSETYFDTEVTDNYRWLEDDMSKETEAWVGKQNETTFSFLDQIPFRSELKNRLEQIWNYEKLSAPFKEGDYTYFYKNDGLQNQYVVYRQKERRRKGGLSGSQYFCRGRHYLFGRINFFKIRKISCIFHQ